jgi:GGDEF domain-containing protein
MLSPSLSQLLERARTRFGLEVEVIDATLQHVYPDGATALARMIEGSADVRQSLLGALAGGRPERVDTAGLQYQVFPLRSAASVRKGSALVAVRQAGAVRADEDQVWPELARGIVEADFAASAALSDEQQHSRRLLGALRFARHLAETESEADLAHAVIHAAAVWFDVDARIFERDLLGDFVLHTSLPGAQVEEAARHLSAALLGPAAEPVRLGPLSEWGALASESEVTLVPFPCGPRTNWVLALIGALPAESEVLLAVLGPIAGMQLETIKTARRERVRARLQSLVEHGGGVHELVAVSVIRELAELTRAGAASLVLTRVGRERRLVCLGASAEFEPPTPRSASSSGLTSAGFVCTLPLGNRASATLTLEPAPGERFGSDAALVTEVATDILHAWLTAAEPSLVDVPQEPRSRVSEFVRRIEEELERAKRFDLRFSLVVVQIARAAVATGDATSLMEDVLRQELRGSDVLGTMDGDRIAALLTHTDSAGSHTVVDRLLRRLSETAERLQLAGVTVGQAAFSPECCTADALLSQAASGAQAVFA